MTGIELIAKERARQVEEEGYTPDTDSILDEGQLAWAACYYAMPYMAARRCPSENCPCPIVPDDLYEETGWDSAGAKRSTKNRVRQLTVAGALLAAEIDRLQIAVE